MILREYQLAAVNAALNWIKYKDIPSIIVLPTGAGKSLVMAALAEKFCEEGHKVLVIAHRKELLQQFSGKLSIPFGFYSASIGEKKLDLPITVASIQSITNVENLPKYQRIIIDEAHRISNNEEGQYWDIIKRNPEAKICTLTATPYRLKGGKLGWGEEIYSIPYEYLVSQGYLSKLTNKVKDVPSLDGVEIVAGDYKEDTLAQFMSDPKLIEAAVRNIITYGTYRYSVIIFCVNKAHCNLMYDAMKRNGLQSMVVTGDTPDAERGQAIEDFKEGRLRYLINCQIFTEGFDAPCTDMVVLLRPTKSKALFEQMCGRGVRIFEGKEDCFLLDMAGNLEEHDGYGSPYHEKSRKESIPKKGRLCPACEAFVKPKGLECPECGYIFEKIQDRLASHDYNANIDGETTFTKTKKHNVRDVLYREHRSKKGSVSLRVDYVVSGYKYGVISEWLSVYHENDWVRNKAYKFFNERDYLLGSDTKEYTMEHILWHAERLKRPSAITVDHSEKFPRIIHYEWEDKKPESESLQQDINDLLNGDTIMF